MFIGGIFIGNYNEILFSSIVIVVIAYYTYLKFSKNEGANAFPSKSLNFFLLGDVIGGGGFSSPHQATMYGLAYRCMAELLFLKNCCRWEEVFYITNIYYTCFLSLVVLSAVRIADCEKNKNEVIKFMIVGMTTLVISIMQFLPIGQYDFDDRMFMFWIVVALLWIFFSAIGVSNVEKILLYHKRTILCCSITFLTVFMSSTIYAYQSIFEYNESVRALIEKSNIAGIEDVVIPRYAKVNTIFNHVISGSVSEDKNFWVNKCTAAYYGVNSVVLKK